MKMATTTLSSRNTGVFSYLFALQLAVAVQHLVSSLIPGVTEEWSLLITISVAAIAYMLVLGTGFLKAAF